MRAHYIAYNVRKTVVRYFVKGLILLIEQRSRVFSSSCEPDREPQMGTPVYPINILGY
jgi:hypothetical protein